MSNEVSIIQTVEAWAEIVIKEWIKKAKALNIPEREMLRSFTNHVISNSNNDPRRVVFLFNYYVKMVDMGVGSGVKLGERDSLIAAGLTKRKPQDFFYGTFYKQLAVLRHLLEEKHALNIERLVVLNLEKKS